MTVERRTPVGPDAIDHQVRVSERAWRPALVLIATAATIIASLATIIIVARQN